VPRVLQTLNLATGGCRDQSGIDSSASHAGEAPNNGAKHRPGLAETTIDIAPLR
jgi:hypothetical protein